MVRRANRFSHLVRTLQTQGQNLGGLADAGKRRLGGGHKETLHGSGGAKKVGFTAKIILLLEVETVKPVGRGFRGAAENKRFRGGGGGEKAFQERRFLFFNFYFGKLSGSLGLRGGGTGDLSAEVGFHAGFAAVRLHVRSVERLLGGCSRRAAKVGKAAPATLFKLIPKAAGVEVSTVVIVIIVIIIKVVEVAAEFLVSQLGLQVGLDLGLAAVDGETGLFKFGGSGGGWNGGGCGSNVFIIVIILRIFILLSIIIFGYYKLLI